MNGIIPLGARRTTPRVTVVLPRLHVLDIPARFVAPSRSGRPPEEAPDREPLSGRQPRVPFPSPTELAPGATRVDAAPGLAPGPRLGSGSARLGVLGAATSEHSPSNSSAPSAPPAAHPVQPHVDTQIGVFGARAKARELASKVNRLTDENTHLRNSLERLGVLDVIELEAARERIREEIATLKRAKEHRRVQIEEELRTSAERTTQRLERSRKALQKKVDRLEAEEKRQHARAIADTRRHELRLAELREQIVVSEDAALQAVHGIPTLWMTRLLIRPLWPISRTA